MTLDANGQSIDFHNFPIFEGLKNYCITKSVSDVANATNRHHSNGGEENKLKGWKAAVTAYFPHFLMLLDPKNRSYVLCAYCHQLLQYLGVKKGFVSHAKCPMQHSFKMGSKNIEHLSLAHTPRLWSKDINEENNETPRNSFKNWNAFIVGGDTCFLS